MKVRFVDFWPGFDPRDNFLLNHLKTIGDFTVDDEPDVLFYSCYGNEYRKFKIPRLFYSAENLRPDFSACDFAITFDYNSDPRHFRYPLFAVYSDIYDWWPQLLQHRSDSELLEEWQKKSKFCAIVVSNGQSQRRNDFFRKLNAAKQVDSGGRFMNNVGGPVPDKLAFIRDYRFVISFENSSYPGYTTEKLVEPLLTGAIPIYWGNPAVAKEFNSDRFLVAQDAANDSHLIDTILAIDKNPELALPYLRQPVFPNNQRSRQLVTETLCQFLSDALNLCSSIRPVAIIPEMRALHFIKRQAADLRYRLKAALGKTYR